MHKTLIYIQNLQDLYRVVLAVWSDIQHARFQRLVKSLPKSLQLAVKEKDLRLNLNADFYPLYIYYISIYIKGCDQKYIVFII